ARGASGAARQRASTGDVFQHWGWLQGRPTTSAVGCGPPEKAKRGPQQRQSGCALSADGTPAVSRASAAEENRPNPRPDCHHLRSELWPASDLPGRTSSTEQRFTAMVVRFLDREVGRRRARVRNDGFRDGGWLDIWGSPLTDAAKLT